MSVPRNRNVRFKQSQQKMLEEILQDQRQMIRIKDGMVGFFIAGFILVVAKIL